MTHTQHLQVVVPAVCSPDPNSVAQAVLAIQASLLNAIKPEDLCGYVTVDGYRREDALPALDLLMRANASSVNERITFQYDQCHAFLTDPSSDTVLLVGSVAMHLPS